MNQNKVFEIVLIDFARMCIQCISATGIQPMCCNQGPQATGAEQKEKNSPWALDKGSQVENIVKRAKV